MLQKKSSCGVRSDEHSSEGDGGDGADSDESDGTYERSKLVIVVRGDVTMSVGKVAAQCCHAAVEAALECSEEQMDGWDEDGQPIIIVKGGNEQNLYGTNVFAAGSHCVSQHGAAGESYQSWRACVSDPGRRTDRSCKRHDDLHGSWSWYAATFSCVDGNQFVLSFEVTLCCSCVCLGSFVMLTVSTDS